ncbi:MAG: hypothetical protein ACI4PG_12145 [Candidatus Ventricola sp.]
MKHVYEIFGRNDVGLSEMGNCGLLVTRGVCFAITSNIGAPRMRDEKKLEEMGFEIHAPTWYETAFEGELLRRLTKGGPIGYAGRDYRVDFGTPGTRIRRSAGFLHHRAKSEDTIISTAKGIIPVSQPVIAPKITLEVCGQTFVRPDIWQA